jgi:membrane associated rhomboid family serine protease
VTKPSRADSRDPAEAVDVAAWARDDAFAAPPGGKPWGWVDRRGNHHPCDSAEALAAAVSADHDGTMDLAWSPASRHLVVPEEIPELAEPLLSAHQRMARSDFSDLARRFIWFSLVLVALAAYQFYGGWVRLPADDPAAKARLVLRLMAGSTTLGIAVLGWLIFGFIPFYQAWRRRRETREVAADRLVALVPVLRFETWLSQQRSPVTRLFPGAVFLVYLFQLLAPNDIAAAGLVKSRYAAGEWWRILTAPFLHGFIPHLLMNAAAMFYLGRRIEVLARWPHLPLVFLLAAWTGGEFSARLIEAPTVGASGGLMGWLGFLLVFETLHRPLVPKSCRRRLLAGVLLTAVIGVIGYRFIDNAAHAGGLAAGMLYAWIVFPKSTSPTRPRVNATDRIVGALAGALLAGACGFAIWRLVIDWLASR